jgi:carbon-monoxide dehydrogenase medium subunit
MLPPFEIHQAATADEAAALRARLGEAAAVYAGGSELLLAMKEGVAAYDHLIDVKTIHALHGHGLAVEGGTLVIGAATTHRELERSPLVRQRFPLLAEMARQVANVRVRAVGTLGGNLCFAEPHSDPPTALLVHDAVVALHGTAGPRRLALGEFIVGPYETALGGDEILTAVEVPPAPGGAAGAYLKLSLHERPTVGVAALVVPDGRRRAVAEARVAIGCVGPVPARLPALEAALAGAPLAALEAGFPAANGAGDALDAVADLHGSADYKRAMAGVFARRALALAARRALAAAA